MRDIFLFNHAVLGAIISAPVFDEDDFKQEQPHDDQRPSRTESE